MSESTVITKIKNGARIVDVRTPDEYMDESYPGSVNIPVGELQQRLGELEPKTRPIVVYCASGGRSALAARLLLSTGFTDVTNAGGLFDMPQL